MLHTAFVWISVECYPVAEACGMPVAKCDVVHFSNRLNISVAEVIHVKSVFSFVPEVADEFFVVYPMAVAYYVLV